MQDTPTALEILATVITHLRDRVLPTLEGRAVFEMRVTLSALELVRREFTLKPASDQAELDRLGVLLGRSGGLAELNDALCQQIVAGDLDVSSPGLLAHLRQTSIEKLAVDQPAYSAYRRAGGASTTPDVRPAQPPPGSPPRSPESSNGTSPTKEH